MPTKDGKPHDSKIQNLLSKSIRSFIWYHCISSTTLPRHNTLAKTSRCSPLTCPPPFCSSQAAPVTPKISVSTVPCNPRIKLPNKGRIHPRNLSVQLRLEPSLASFGPTRATDRNPVEHLCKKDNMKDKQGPAYQLDTSQYLAYTIKMLWCEDQLEGKCPTTEAAAWHKESSMCDVSSRINGLREFTWCDKNHEK